MRVIRWGKDVAQTCGSSFFSPFGAGGLSSQFDAIAIMLLVPMSKERAHTNSLDANYKFTRSHVRDTIASRKRQVVMRKVKSIIQLSVSIEHIICSTNIQKFLFIWVMPHDAPGIETEPI